MTQFGTNCELIRFVPPHMGLPGFLGSSFKFAKPNPRKKNGGLLGENRQIRSSYAEVYHRGSPEMGFPGGGGVLRGRITFERFDRF